MGGGDGGEVRSKARGGGGGKPIVEGGDVGEDISTVGGGEEPVVGGDENCGVLEGIV